MTWRLRVAVFLITVGLFLSSALATAAIVPTLTIHGLAMQRTITTRIAEAVARPAPCRSPEESCCSVREETLFAYDSTLNSHRVMGEPAATGACRDYADPAEHAGGRDRGVLYSAAEAVSAAGGAETLSASAIRFSQSSVSGVGPIAESMAARGWAGAPIDVVRLESGLVTVDNTKLLAAHMTGTPVQAIVRGAGEALPASMAGRFVSRAGAEATTWGEAVLFRIQNQNAAYRSRFPNGSWATGASP